MSFRTHYLERLGQIENLTYEDFEKVYDFYVENLDSTEFTQDELYLLDDVKEQFAMTANARLSSEDRELGLITWPEFQHFVRNEILPSFSGRA
jgi:hypothetical protein